MHRTQLFLPEDMHATLKSEAEENEMSLSEYVRRILEDYLQKHGRKISEEGIHTLLKMSEQEEGDVGVEGEE